MPQMKRAVEALEALKKEGLRDTVKIIVGGRLTQEFAEEIGADAYGKDAFDAREVISKWIFSN
jgi:5-methyltetrahydrofolate--homocysteine methyltransferase